MMIFNLYVFIRAPYAFTIIFISSSSPPLPSPPRPSRARLTPAGSIKCYSRHERYCHENWMVSAFCCFMTLFSGARNVALLQQGLICSCLRRRVLLLLLRGKDYVLGLQKHAMTVELRYG